MNLVDFDEYQDDEFGYLVKNFKKHDYKKILIIVDNLLKKIKKLNPTIDYEINLLDASHRYEGILHKVNKLKINIIVGTFVNTFVVDIPQLCGDHLFHLNGSMYVPILFLERSLIDRVKKDKTDVCFFNLGSVQLGVDYNLGIVKCNNNKMSISDFVSVVYKDDKRADSFYKEFGLPTLGEENAKVEFYRLFGFINYHMEPNEFINDFMLIDYFRETFMDYFGDEYFDFKTIFTKVLEYKDIEIDMADLRNRRVVFSEYLIKPFFYFYYKTLVSQINKTGMLPSLQNNVVMKAFRKEMHGEQLFNIAIPFTAPLAHKVSQHIVVIKEKLPKPWTACHPSAKGKICPITVSAQDMGNNLTFTQETRINFYGRVQIAK